jgi:hypothetical protein
MDAIRIRYPHCPESPCPYSSFASLSLFSLYSPSSLSSPYSSHSRHSCHSCPGALAILVVLVGFLVVMALAVEKDRVVLMYGCWGARIELQNTCRRQGVSWWRRTCGRTRLSGVLRTRYSRRIWKCKLPNIYILNLFKLRLAHSERSK